MKKISVCLACMFILLCALSGTAEARKTLVLKNNAPYELFAAFCYKNNESQQWLVKGWWRIKAKSTRTVHLDTNNGHVYVYAENRHHKLYYAGNNSSSNRYFTVFDAEFRTASDTKRTSEGSRRVRFRHLNFEQKSKMTYTLNYN